MSTLLRQPRMLLRASGRLICNRSIILLPHRRSFNVSPISHRYGASAVAGGMLLGCCVMESSTCEEAKAKSDVEVLLTEAYKGLSGDEIGEKEEDSITAAGGHWGYGEITYEGVRALCEHLKINNNTVFYDLGSGLGKMVMQIHLEFHPKSAVGIELSPTRHAAATTARQRLMPALNQSGNTVTLRLEDQQKADVRDATVVYVASLLHSAEFMEQVANRLHEQCLELDALVSLSKLPDSTEDLFELQSSMQLPMTWSDATTAYVYKRKPRECGFCKFMKAGPCGEVFQTWEDCVDQARDSKKDFVESCTKQTLALKACVDSHPEYYSDLMSDPKPSEGAEQTDAPEVVADTA